MKIKIFGKLTDIFQTTEYIINNVSTVLELKKELEFLFPALKSMTYLLVINNEVIKDNISIPADAEIALLPPYSGG